MPAASTVVKGAKKVTEMNPTTLLLLAGLAYIAYKASPLDDIFEPIGDVGKSVGRGLGAVTTGAQEFVSGVRMVINHGRPALRRSDLSRGERVVTDNPITRGLGYENFGVDPSDWRFWLGGFDRRFMGIDIGHNVQVYDVDSPGYRQALKKRLQNEINRRNKRVNALVTAQPIRLTDAQRRIIATPQPPTSLPLPVSPDFETWYLAQVYYGDIS